MSEKSTPLPAWARLIKEFRKRKGWSQQVLADTLGTSQGNLANWERGSYKPSPENFMALSRLAEGETESLGFMEFAGVAKEFFMGDTKKGMTPTLIAEQAVREAEERRVSELVARGILREGEGKIRHVPLLRDSAAAGPGRVVNEKDITRMVPFPADWLSNSGELYMLSVEGDSMDPIILDGHKVIVDISKRNPAELVNSMVAADNDGITIKWLREDNGDYLLVPNHVSVRHPVRRLKPGSGITIVGEVVNWIGHPPAPPKIRSTKKGRP